MASPKSKVTDGDDNWLGSYINSTEFGSNPKLNSNPVKAPAKKESADKKFYFLHTRKVVAAGSARRNSTSVVETQRKEYHSNALKSSVVPVIESLPERVNVIREQDSVNGHFIREHRISEKDEYDLSSTQGVAPGSVRRKSLDFDELEAVKERVSQVTDLWQKERPRHRESTDTITSEDGEVIPAFQVASQNFTEIRFASDSFPKSTMTSFFKKTEGQKQRRGFFSKLFRRAV